MELGIEMAEHGPSHRVENPRLDVRRARPTQQPVRRIENRNRLGHTRTVARPESTVQAEMRDGHRGQSLRDDARMASAIFEAPQGGMVVVNPLGGDAVFKVRGGESDGRMTVFETVVRPGEGPPLHIHANEEETLYVLAGEVRFKLGDEIRTGGAGAFAFIPRGAPHTWQAVGDVPVRMLIHFSPAGMERFFEEFAESKTPGTDAFASIGGRTGMAVVGPPLAQSDPL
jgi:quercetin dioxygenase-like cupin family protein